MAEGTILTGNPLNYHGALFGVDKTETPLFNMFRGRRGAIQNNEFAIGTFYEIGAANKDGVTEVDSLLAPDPTFVERTFEKNVTQAFHEALAISDMRLSNVAKLAGINQVGNSNNVSDEWGFQIARKMDEIRLAVEDVIINGEYQAAVNTTTAGKTRGLREAIVSNALDLNGEEVDPDAMNDILQAVFAYPVSVQNLMIVCTPTQKRQITKNYGKVFGFQTSSVTDSGANISLLHTDFGDIRTMVHPYLADGEMLLLDTSVCGIVEQPVPGKGNFYFEELGTVGAGKKAQIFGQLGLDYGAEWKHAKLTGVATTVGKLNPSSDPS